MIWIHGGGFCCGSGNDDVYGPDFLVRQGVILVTLNYRLEILGFLCLDTEDIPGNAGVKDQVAAMRWVRKNIANFGGDPDNVTIFGQSAGASCVSYHCVSPMTKGLFKRAIAQSGSLNSWTANGYRLRERTIQLAKQLGCNSEDDKELYDFLKNQPREKLLKIQVPLTFFEKCRDKYETQYTIVSEKVFPNVETYFTGNIYDALKNNIHEDVDLILGFNSDEGIINFSVIFDLNETINHANQYREYFVPKVLSRYCSIDDQLDIGKAMKEYYLKNKSLTIHDLNPLVNYYSAEVCKIDIITFARYFADKNKVYMYKFSCKSERNFFSTIMGATQVVKDRPLAGHSDEVPYLFPVKSINQKINKTSPIFKLIQNVTKLWTNFAKTG